MKGLLGDSYDAFAQALTQDRQPTSIRLNRDKRIMPPAAAMPVEWSAGVGFYLPERPTFTFDPLFHAGAYYVQEAASMFLGEVIKQYIDAPVRYLDLCAAPGGKSTHALSLLPQGSLVVSNEVVRQRAQILAENITKWGNIHAVVTNNMPADWGTWHNYFDVIATDVPCSGEGMFRKDETAIAEWSEANVMHCAARQEGILEDIWDALRPGGLLIYSTCTYNLEENEQMVQHLISRYDAEPLQVAIEPHWGISGALSGDVPVYRFLPHLTQGEGLFMAVLRKGGEPDGREHRVPAMRDKRKANTKQKPLPVPAEVKKWVAQDDITFVAGVDEITAYPTAYAEDMLAMKQQFNVLHAGLPLAVCKGRDLLPTHALALSVAFNREAFALCEVSLDVALAYLRREAITLPDHAPRGYVAITYRDVILGWVKNLGNRANNLYPQEWRIRSNHNPDEIVEAGVVPCAR